MISTVTERGQTAIPSAIRHRYHLMAHTRIEWIDDGHTIAVVPLPDDPIRALKGKYRGRNFSNRLMKSRVEDRHRE